jgi:hypothetical protein
LSIVDLILDSPSNFSREEREGREVPAFHPGNMVSGDWWELPWNRQPVKKRKRIRISKKVPVRKPLNPQPLKGGI